MVIADSHLKKSLTTRPGALRGNYREYLGQKNRPFLAAQISQFCGLTPGYNLCLEHTLTILWHPCFSYLFQYKYPKIPLLVLQKRYQIIQ